MIKIKWVKHFYIQSASVMRRDNLKGRYIGHNKEKKFILNKSGNASFTSFPRFFFFFFFFLSPEQLDQLN